MAAAGGVPTIFLTSNSHKTRSVQALLDYSDPKEFPVCPTEQDIIGIRTLIEELLADRNTHSQRIRAAFERQSKLAGEYSSLIGQPTRVTDARHHREICPVNVH
jgi:hypothetical protein